MLGSLSVKQVQDPVRLGKGAVCFVGPGPGPLQSELQMLRDLHGETIYLIALIGVDMNPMLQSGLFDAGTNDILFEGDTRQLLPCLLRAKRHLEQRYEGETWRKALQDKLDAWQDGLDHLPTPIYIKDVDGRYIGCNTAFSSFVGKTQDEVLGSRLHDLLDKEVADAHAETDADLLRRGGVLRLETDVCIGDIGMRHVMLHKARMTAQDGSVRGLAGVLIDITERKELEARLTLAAERDPLTNAFNRRKFFQVATDAISAAQNADEPFAVAVIDIDNFKSINDELGHAEGDVTLCSIVDILRSHEKDGVLVARAGGEEFFAFFAGTAVSTAADSLSRMRADIARYCQVHTDAGSAGTISIGLAVFQPVDETIDQALRRADLALYRAKRDGRNRLCLAS